MLKLYLFTLFTVLAVTNKVATEDYDDVDEDWAACVKKVNVTEEELKDMYDNSFNLPKGHALNCCYYKRTKLIQNDKFHIKRMIQYFNGLGLYEGSAEFKDAVACINKAQGNGDEYCLSFERCYQALADSLPENEGSAEYEEEP